MIGRLHHVILDCPEPAVLAAFYSQLLGLPVTYADDDFAVVSTNTTSSGLGFQRVPDHQRPRWADPAHPQQMHLDVMTDDVTTAAEGAAALGATPLAADGGSQVMADPAGHPFCLIPRPAWAAPVRGAGPEQITQADLPGWDQPR